MTVNDGFCKCGKKIVWATTHHGKKIPLDALAPTYIASRDQDGTLRAIRHTAMVSHFATCPNANEFSGSRKAP